MRFMMCMKATKDSEAGLPPDPRLMAAIGKLVEEHQRAGILVSTGGLGPSYEGECEIRPMFGPPDAVAPAAACAKD